MFSTREHDDRKEAATVATSFRQQLWLIAASGRWLYPIGGLMALMMLVGIGGSKYSITAGVLAIVAGAIWPSILWHGETPARRVYHWSLPVPRAAHDLVRVLVGAIYLLGICAVLGVAGAVGDGTFVWFSAGGAQAWLGFFLAPLVAYCLMMPLSLWSDYPVTRRTLTFFLLYGFAAVIAESFGFDLMVRMLSWGLADGRWSFAETLTDGVAAMYRGGTLSDPDPTHASQWFIGAAIWIAIGAAVTTFTAVFRPDDLKRRFAASSSDAAPLAT